jgi:hypothetical protein
VQSVSTVSFTPNWSVCSADRFSRSAGVTKVQLASQPEVIWLLQGEEAEGPAAAVMARVRWRANLAGYDPPGA